MYAIHWIVICLMDNVIHPLNNWGQLIISKDVGALRKLILAFFISGL